MTEKIMVRWGGRDVEVAMSLVEGRLGNRASWERGRIGPITVDRQLWDQGHKVRYEYCAWVWYPGVLDPGESVGCSLDGYGDTAQEALDRLTDRFAAVTAWVAETMRSATVVAPATDWVREGVAVRQKSNGHIWRIRDRTTFDTCPWFALCDDSYRTNLPTYSLAQLLDLFEPVVSEE